MVQVKNILLILGLIVAQHRVHCQITIALELFNFAWSALEKLNTAHDAYGKFTTPSTADIMDKTIEIAESIDKLGNRLEEKIQESMDTLLTRLPLAADISNDIRLLNSYVTRIDELYADMEHYLTLPEHFSEDALNDLIKSYTSRDGDDVQGNIALIHGLLVPQGLGQFKKSLFVLLAQETQEYALEVCGTGASPQYRLVQLFDIVMTTEMRGFAMQGFGALMKGYMNGKNYTGDITRAQMGLVKRANDYVPLIQKTMSLSARQFRQCDPPMHIRDDTFFEFHKFLQAFVVQENALRYDHRCPAECAAYSKPQPLYRGCRGFECTYSPTTCRGRLALCKSLGSSAKACEYDGSFVRRYEWFESASGVVYGDKVNGCPKPASTVYGFKVTWQETICFMCRCICVEDDFDSQSRHFVSLREQLSDIENNMVVTGLAFVMKNDIAHIQIQQSQMTSQAGIVDNTTHWVELEDIQYDTIKSNDMYKFMFVKKSENGEDEAMKESKDVATLTWDRRRFHLDTLVLPENHVVTGIRIYRTDTEARSLQIHIRATSFDSETGQLDPDTTTWIEPSDMPYYSQPVRYEHDYSGFKSPLKSHKTAIDSQPFHYMDLDWTSYVDDAGQTTIPLLDGVPVAADPPTPLSGVGLYHKRQTGYAGFLTLVLEAVDKSRYVNVNFGD